MEWRKSGSPEVGDQPDLAVCGVVDHIDADVDEPLVQDVFAVPVVGRLLVVHSLLQREYAGLRTVAVVGNVFADGTPVISRGRDSRTESCLAIQLVAQRIGFGHCQVVGMRGVNELAVHLQGRESMVRAFGIQLFEHCVGPIRAGCIAR